MTQTLRAREQSSRALNESISATVLVWGAAISTVNNVTILLRPRRIRAGGAGQ